MSEFVALSSRTAPARNRDLPLDTIVAAVLIVFPLGLLLSWPRIVTVWTTGAFFDTDDAMRMVQIRAWMSGQGWFDLTVHRLDPPQGLFLHWSRIVDVPMAILIRLFGIFADPVTAERLARLVFPIALQGGLIAATAWVAGRLAGPRAVLPGAFLVLMSGISYAQFQPGRIDHHAPQILLLMLMTGTLLASLDPARARWAAATGLAIAVSLAISLENLPFMIVVIAAPAIAWIIDGKAFRRTILVQALGLGAAVPVMFAGTVAPWRYAIGSCDAFSIAHVSGILLGSAGLLLLGLFTNRLRTRALRLMAVADVGLCVLCALRATFPACLGDPYGAMDPLLKTLWLSNVTEAQPIWVAAALRPDTITLVIAPMLAGVLATLVAATWEKGADRARWLVILALVLVGCAGTLWEIRVASSVQPLAVLGGAWAVSRAMALAHRRGQARWLVAPFGLTLLFSAMAWIVVPVPEMSPEARAASEGGAACRQSAALAPLATLEPGLAFAPIDAGSHLLAYTRLSVIAAPYHRNQRGNLAVLRGLMAEPEAARRLVAATGARYLILCPSGVQAQAMARAAPQGLAARIIQGDVPAWLQPVPVSGAAYRVFAIR